MENNPDHIFIATKIHLVYTYPGDQATPEKEYEINGFGADTVLSRCTDQSIINIAVESEKLRYALQVEIGRRNIGHVVDKEMARFFQVGKMDSCQHQKEVTSLDQISQGFLDELDELDL